ncbi:RNA-directed DNA polymerase, eukaryota, reverse transcriptase zinc-binding domain protein [Tanacetum coccineum]
MGDQRPKEDGVYNIFTSIFVTNFPDQTNAKELWRLCNQYGNVIDSFIPNRRSKVGKRFGFVRFIKIYDVERLVNNLCTIWIGNFELHANIAKFNRTPLHKGNHLPNIHANVRPAPVVSSKTHGDSSSYIQAVKAGVNLHYVVSDAKVSKPALLLDDSCLNVLDYSLSLVGKLKEFSSLPNLKMLLVEEGFTDLTISYLGGFWVSFQFLSKTSKENFMSHVGVNSWFIKILQGSSSFVVDERVTLIDIEGVPLCMLLILMNESVDSKLVDNHKKSPLENDSESEVIPETVFEGQANVESKSTASKDVTNESDLKFPPGFTPSGDVNQECTLPVHDKDTVASYKEDTNVSSCSGHFHKVKSPKTGGSMLQVIEDLIKVGQTMGYKMEGCMKDIEEIVNSQGVWNGDVIVMGDFNEVHHKDERYGSIFNARGADAFNLFISAGGFVEVPSGGYSFTWSYNSASKMSKLDRFLVYDNLQRTCPNLSSLTLDRFLSDHRPILLRELNTEYGPTPFHFFTTGLSSKALMLLWLIHGKTLPFNGHNAIIKLAKSLYRCSKGIFGHCLRNKIMIWKRFWNLIKGDVVEAVNHFFNNGFRHSGGRSLSPFLSFLSMESLHLSFQKVVNAGLYKGVVLDNSLQISHLFYADDVVFIGQWCDSNISTIIRVLDCFFQASGMRINLHKSKIMGIAVDNSLVTQAANSIGCLTLSLPF